MLIALISMLYIYWFALCYSLNIAAPVFIPRQRIPYGKAKALSTQNNLHIKQQRKPEWVRHEVIRLKAFMLHDGCRTIADTFNRLYADKRQITVGKTFVYQTIQKHRYEINILRRKIRHKRPRLVPKNLIWSMDLTQISDSQHQTHIAFGIIDSGTRACLYLDKAQTKASIALLRCLLNTVDTYGKPKAVRTDNEAVFTSRLFRFGLWLLNIKHQRTDICCPWMNGRIERFFGTLKRKLHDYSIHSVATVSCDLATYRFWYNHIRTHQHLHGKTPAEVWADNKPGKNTKPKEFSAWDGILTGYYLPPS